MIYRIDVRTRPTDPQEDHAGVALQREIADFGIVTQSITPGPRLGYLELL